MTGSVEHRWGQRVQTDLAVLIVRDGWMRGVGRMKNVSLSGAMLTTAFEIPLHANITVSPLGGSEPREIFAAVVRAEPGCVAVEWRDMASRQILDLIESVSTDGAALEARDPWAA
jgi:hypothetical protein